jgi:hypothetical protein
MISDREATSIRLATVVAVMVWDQRGMWRGGHLLFNIFSHLLSLSSMHALCSATKSVCTRRVSNNVNVHRSSFQTQPRSTRNIRRALSTATVMTTRESTAVPDGYPTSSTSSANSDPPHPTTPSPRPTNSSHTLSDQEWDIRTGPCASLFISRTF